MLPDSKNGEPRVVPIIPQLRPYLKAVPFGHHVRTYYTGSRRRATRLKIRDLTYHDLRRSGATILLNANPPVPLEIVAHIMGNSLEVARKVYARVLNRTAHRLMTKGFKSHQNPIRAEARGEENRRKCLILKWARLDSNQGPRDYESFPPIMPTLRTGPERCSHGWPGYLRARVASSSGTTERCGSRST
jgi:hypothetical protein